MSIGYQLPFLPLLKELAYPKSQLNFRNPVFCIGINAYFVRKYVLTSVRHIVVHQK